MLYKYLSPDRVDILENCHIRFTQAAAFNDLFEIKPHITSIVPEDEAQRQLREMLPESLKQEYLKMPPQARASLSYGRFLHLAQDRLEQIMPQALTVIDGIRPMVQEGISGFAEKIGILSLTENPDNLLMWAHYALNHEGFALGIDNLHPYFDCRKGAKDELRHLRKVKYVEQRPNLPMIELTGEDILLTKSSLWSYENEWRILRALQEADKVIEASPHPIHLFSFPPEIVRTIILGNRISAGLKDKIIQIVSDKEKYSSIEVLQATQDEQEYKLNFKTVYLPVARYL